MMYRGREKKKRFLFRIYFANYVRLCRNAFVSVEKLSFSAQHWLALQKKKKKLFADDLTARWQKICVLEFYDHDDTVMYTHGRQITRIIKAHFANSVCDFGAFSREDNLM